MAKNLFSYIFVMIVALQQAFAADPMATDFSYSQCQGSLRPYPDDIKTVSCPDTLVPVMINHVGRHGARFPASAKFCKTLGEALKIADESKTITQLGRELLKINDYVIDNCANRWGALDSLGEWEQRMIASRMYATFKPVFNNAKVMALSSYSPRCMMSMYCFTHQLDRMDNHIEFTTSTGRNNSYLLRPFDTDAEYTDFVKSGATSSVYSDYFNKHCPTSAIERVLGADFAYADDEQKRELAIDEYYVLAGLQAMSLDVDLSRFFTRQEINALWSCFNLRQYLQRTASTVSKVPASITAPLLQNIIQTTDDFIEGKTNVNVMLRFGHAETLMPLLSLMHIKGCYYMTNYFDTVAKNWQDFNVVPMAANVQLIVLKHTQNGKYYVRLDLNETPTPLLPNSTQIYIPWTSARDYLIRCLPPHLQF